MKLTQKENNILAEILADDLNKEKAALVNDMNKYIEDYSENITNATEALIKVKDLRLTTLQGKIEYKIGKRK